MPATNDKDKEIIQKLSGRKLTEQEVFEARQDLLGAFAWLVERDRRQNPQLYDDN